MFTYAREISKNLSIGRQDKSACGDGNFNVFHLPKADELSTDDKTVGLRHFDRVSKC